MAGAFHFCPPPLLIPSMEGEPRLVIFRHPQNALRSVRSHRPPEFSLCEPQFCVVFFVHKEADIRGSANLNPRLTPRHEPTPGCHRTDEQEICLRYNNLPIRVWSCIPYRSRRHHPLTLHPLVQLILGECPYKADTNRYGAELKPQSMDCRNHQHHRQESNDSSLEFCPRHMPFPYSGNAGINAHSPTATRHNTTSNATVSILPSTLSLIWARIIGAIGVKKPRSIPSPRLERVLPLS